jgi:hypothetical protein
MRWDDNARRMRAILFSVLMIGAVTLAESAPPQPPAIPDFARHVPEVKTGEPIFAFNGKNLDGFYSYLREHKYEDPDHVFTVTPDRMLRISGQEFGGITTKRSFKDYKMTAEWKWGEKTWVLLVKGLDRPAGCARDAGILVHCVGEDGAAYGHWLESIEAQIIEGGVGDFLMVGGKKTPKLTCTARPEEKKQFVFDPVAKPVTKQGGRFNWWGRDPQWTDTLGWRDKYGVEKPHGEWNKLEVICDGDSITTVLNGYVVNVGTKSSLTEGKIQIQSEGAEIFYRKFEVRPLVK